MQKTTGRMVFSHRLMGRVMSEVAAHLRWLGLLALAAGLLSCSKSQAPGGVHLNRGLLARWPAPNGAQPAGKPTLSGGVKLRSVMGEQAFFFDGTPARVAVTNASGLNFGARQDFSITARIKPERAVTSFGVMDIVDKRVTSSIFSAVGYELCLENGKLACQLAPFVGRPLKLSDFTSIARLRAAWRLRHQAMPMQFRRFISPGSDLRDGRWHRVALTVKRGSATGGKLFVDGRLVLMFDTTKCVGSLSNHAPLLIGTHPDRTLHCGFKGAIGDVRLYSRALSRSEVAALH